MHLATRPIINFDYSSRAEADILTAPQIAAHSASDRSNVTIRIEPVFGRSSGARLWNGSAAGLTNLSRRKRCAIEFRCPPVPPHLVFTKFVNAFIGPSRRVICVKERIFAARNDDSFHLAGSLGPLLLPP